MLILRLVMALTSNQASAADIEVKSFNACESNEKWDIVLPQKSNWVNRFNVFLQKQEAPWMGFSDAIQLKKISNLMKVGDFEAEFAEYWVGHVFYDLELYPLAFTFFESTKANSKFPELKIAASHCLEKIYQKIPDWNPNPNLKLPVGYEVLQEGLTSNQNRDYTSAIQKIKSFLEVGSKQKVPTHTEYHDVAYLVLGRALYSVGRFKEAVDAFQKVDKKSNLQIDVLNDLAWAYLLSQRYAEAIGVAIQLRSGSLKNTFAPESSMIAAMALNETCFYPDAARTIRNFVQDYEKTFEWLISPVSSSVNPYREILLGLKNQSTVPPKIRSEWLKSSSFMVRQAEINLLIQNSKKIATIPARVKSYQLDLANKNAAIIKKLIKDIRINAIKNENYSELSERLITAKKDIRRVVRFNQAGKILVNVVKKFDLTIPAEREKLVKKINSELLKRNKDMLSLLKKVRENMDLVEVEVYNGASKDLMKAEQDEKNKPAPHFDTAQAWNWGRVTASEIDGAEVWEDEIGAMKANITTRCN